MAELGFYLIASISLLSITNIFIPKKGKIDSYLDLFLIIILILFEIDGVVYHETYDPLIYIVLFLMIKNDIFYKYFLNFNLKKLTIFYLFVFSFYTLSILKTLYSVGHSFVLAMDQMFTYTCEYEWLESMKVAVQENPFL